MYEHEDENGWPYHGQHDTLGEYRSKHKPGLSRDMVSYMESFFVLEVPIDTVGAAFVLFASCKFSTLILKFLKLFFLSLSFFEVINLRVKTFVD